VHPVQPSGWKAAGCIFQRMIRKTLITIGKVGLVLLTGVWPYGRYGWVVVIGACVAVAGVLHFVTP
jgi:hypothetical protein